MAAAVEDVEESDGYGLNYIYLLSNETEGDVADIGESGAVM